MLELELSELLELLLVSELLVLELATSEEEISELLALESLLELLEFSEVLSGLAPPIPTFSESESS